MRKSNCFALMGVVVLLFLGYSIPSAVMVWEDNRLLKELKSVEIDEIELDANGMDVEEILAVFPEVLMNNIVVEADVTVEVVSDYGTGSTEQISSAKEYEKIQCSIDVFWKTLDVEEEVEFVNSKATHYVMMVASDDERVCSLWQFSGIDKDKQEYVIWIEDTSGKVIAFEIPFSYMGKTDENFYISLDALSNYYGFSTFGLNEHFINVYKIEYWENEMVLIDEIVGEKIEVMLYKNGDKLFFNMYPKMHDYSESKTY